jgi:hypothetical protein
LDQSTSSGGELGSGSIAEVGVGSSDSNGADGTGAVVRLGIGTMLAVAVAVAVAVALAVAVATELVVGAVEAQADTTRAMRASTEIGRCIR